MAATQQSRIKPIFYDIAEQEDPRGPQPTASSTDAPQRAWQETNSTHIPDPEKTRASDQYHPQIDLPVRSSFDQTAYSEPPPAYNANDPAVLRDTSSYKELPPSAEQSNSHSRPAPRNDGQLPLPVVIPQTTKAFKGAFYSPFVRAYVPELQMHGISKSDFLTVLDGLNECWVANPVFEGVGLAGAIMQQFYGIHIVQLVGTGVQAAAGLGSAATSFARTQAYVKAVNADLLHPAGLNLGVKTTEKMMQEVDYPAERLELPPLEDESEIDGTAVREEVSQDNTQISANDTRMRRIRALEGYVMPLNFDVPAAVTPDNVLKRMGNAQAQRMAKKQQKKEDKELEKTKSKEEKRARKAEKEGPGGKREKEIAKIDKELEKKHGEMLEKLESRKAQKDEKERRKIEKDWEKESRKLHKEKEKEISKMESKSDKREKKSEKKADKPSKEEKKTQKIRWIVITRWSGDENSERSTADDDDDDSSFEEHER